jgi:glycerate dehydrogenase
VLSVEPPSADNPLLTAPNTIITPHLGWASPEARQRCLNISIENLKAFIDGNPQNVVN